MQIFKNCESLSFGFNNRNVGEMGGRLRWWVTYHKIVIKILIFYARRRIKFELKFFDEMRHEKNHKFEFHYCYVIAKYY